MRLARGMLLAVAAAALAGCGTSERAQVQAKVQQFVKAAAARDYKTICTQVLAPPLLEHMVESGITCQQAMQIALASVTSPTLAIGQITVDGSKASAITLSTAKGQEAALAAIELVKTSQGWRVESLGAPIVPPSKS